MASPPKKIKKPFPARDLSQGNPRDLRNKSLREANKAASKKVGPARDVKAGSTRAKFLADAKAGKIKAKVPSRALVTTTGRALTTTGSKALTTTGSKALTTTGSKALTTAASRLPSVGTIAASGLGLASKAFLGAGSAVVGMVSDAVPAGSAQERSWERRNTEQRRMKGKVSGMGFTGGTPAKTARKYDTAIGPKKPVTTSPTVNMVRPEYIGSNKFKKKSSSGINQFAIAAGNAKDKKKAGATTGAAPVGGTGMKPKRKSWFQRRMAERYAIGSSGKSL